MGSALVYVLVVALVATAVYLLAALVFGRGEELAPMPPGSTPTRLPAGELRGTDVRDLRFQQTLRGYKCSEVDWALERLATEVDALRARLDGLGALPREDPPEDPVADPAPTDPTVPARPDGPGRETGESIPSARGTPAGRRAAPGGRDGPDGAAPAWGGSGAAG